jgi:hypothetical protein
MSQLTIDILRFGLDKQPQKIRAHHSHMIDPEELEQMLQSNG